MMFQAPIFRLHLPLVFGLSLFILGCGEDPERYPVWTPADHAQPGSADQTGRVMRSDEAEGGAAGAGIDAGKTLYVLHCATCHGAGLDGDGPQARAGLPTPTLNSAKTLAKNDEELMERIRLGGGGMPPFGGTIGPEGMIALVDYIRANARIPEAAE